MSDGVRSANSFRRRASVCRSFPLAAPVNAAENFEPSWASSRQFLTEARPPTLDVVVDTVVAGASVVVASVVAASVVAGTGSSVVVVAADSLLPPPPQPAATKARAASKVAPRTRVDMRRIWAPLGDGLAAATLARGLRSSARHS